MRKSKTLKPPKERNKTTIWVAIVTGIFLVIGVTFTIIGFRNEILGWMRNTGIAFLVLCVPLIGVYIYNKLDKRIDS